MLQFISRFIIWVLSKTLFPFMLWAFDHVDAQKIIIGIISNTIQHGQLVMHIPGEEKPKVFGNGGNRPELNAEITVVNSRFFWRCLVAQDIGFAESYMNKEWITPDLGAVMRILAANGANKVDLKAALVLRTINFFNHLRRKNSVENSRQNISEHYDLSNAMYELFLDPTMMYSSAIFASKEDTLEEAQIRKLNLIIDQARLRPEHHLLEIGTGWGSLAIQAAKRTGCKVTSVTLSTEQLEFAKRRVNEAGLSDRIDIQLCDYRLIQGSACFDAVISIEMIEAVGKEYYPSFFATIERVLKPNGVAVLQAITIPDQRFAVYSQSCDFIQKYIFPGGLCPSMSALQQAMLDNSQLVIEELKNYPQHYHRTLEIWAQRFNENASKIKALPGNFDDRFIRMWNYYFYYCSAGFAERSINLVHLTLTRERNLERFPIVVS